jgi:2'-hydroxyisoflavone reductase
MAGAGDQGRPDAMKVLLLGGTGFIGRHVVQALQAAGHAVSVQSRGQTPDALPAVERLHADRDRGAAVLEALAGRQWQACVDISGLTPRQVRPVVDALHAHIDRYVYVSAVSVYGDPTERPVRETQPRLPPAADNVVTVDGRTYGPLKVACEDIVLQRLGERATVLRPQVVVGPHDPSGRYAHWVQRARLPGPMLAPGNGRDHLQVIDVRDLARFVASLLASGTGGCFNVAGPRITWHEFIALLAPAQVEWVPAQLLQAAGLDFNDLPLYRTEPGARSSLMDIDAGRALAAGLRLTPPAQTLRDVQAWLRGEAPRLALGADVEARLIAQARAAQSR